MPSHRDTSPCALQEAAAQGARLIVLPEMWNCPYSNDSFPTYAEDIEADQSPSTAMLSQAAREHQVTLVGGSVPERSSGKLFNTCCVYGTRGDLLAKHRKVRTRSSSPCCFKLQLSCVQCLHMLNCHHSQGSLCPSVAGTCVHCAVRCSHPRPKGLHAYKSCAPAPQLPSVRALTVDCISFLPGCRRTSHCCRCTCLTLTSLARSPSGNLTLCPRERCSRWWTPQQGASESASAMTCAFLSWPWSTGSEGCS